MSAPSATRIRDLRALALVLALVLAVAILLGVAANQERRGFLDPAAVDTFGGRALARLLEDQGVSVEYVRGSPAALDAAGPESTLFVTVPWLVTQQQAEQLIGTGADVVLAGVGSEVALFVPDTTVARGEVRELAPRCDLSAAERAGRALMGGTTFQLPDRTAAASCYPIEGRPSLIEVREGNRTVTALGSAELFTNEHLDEGGNASLAMGLLGGHRKLVWYRPVIERPPDGGQSFSSLLPSWVAPAALQLFIAGALAALWRGRRLGGLVPEPLPVVVPAGEAERGRARLYQRSRSRAHAAAVLRSAAMRRLREELSMPGGPQVEPSEVIALAAAHTGRLSAELATVLTGPPPVDDAALVRLARDLDAVEREVRRS